MSPPFLVPLEKTVGAFTRRAQRLGPLVEERAAVLGEGVGALAVGPFGGDEPLLFERAEQAVEIAHLDARLAGQLGEPLEELVPVCRALAQEEQQRSLCDPLDAGKAPPVPVVPAPGAWAVPHAGRRCKTHM